MPEPIDQRNSADEHDSLQPLNTTRYTPLCIAEPTVVYYVGGVAITWSDSADKHGIDRKDAQHAIMHAHYVEREFDEPRLPGRVRPTLFIGPPRQLGGPLLEVMVELIEPRDIHVFHVMVARQKHLDRMGDQL